MQRREFIASASAVLAAPASIAAASGSDAIAALEATTGGRLGVYATDLRNERTIAHRAGERFPMCSTFKLLLTAAVLARVESGRERLDRKIHYKKSDLLAYAPVTTAHVAQGYMTVGALCEAAIELSDNTAANLLLASVGGPEEIGEYALSLGDSMTRQDRFEPYCNTAIPGDPRDTTTPTAIAKDMRALMFGNALSLEMRGHLADWLFNSKTGTDCIRAGVPGHWAVGDKTGSGKNGTRNDVAALFPSSRAPIVIAAYLTGSTISYDRQAAVLAKVASTVVDLFP